MEFFLTSGQGGVAGVGVHAGGAHGQDDAQVAALVGEEQDQHGGAAGERQVKVLCWRRLVGAEAGEGRLGDGLGSAREERRRVNRQGAYR